MTFGTEMGFGVDKDESRKVYEAFREEGGNFIDTANMYEGYNRSAGSAGGVAEEILGKALAGKRDKAIVATKVGMQVGQAPEDDYTSPAAILKQLDKSLKRLKMVQGILQIFL